MPWQDVAGIHKLVYSANGKWKGIFKCEIETGQWDFLTAFLDADG